MAVFERTTVVSAPFEEVWAFHATLDCLLAVTPGWIDMRVERIAAPDGRSDAEELAVGTEVRLSVRPFGFGPRIAWTSRIVEREYEGDRAFFEDRMVEGPVPMWEHRHEFVALDRGTRIVDRVRYELPIDPLGVPSSIARPVLAAIFARRHRRTREELEREFPKR